MGNAVLSEVIRLELGKNVPAALVLTALTSSIIANLQKSNLVLSGISASGVATDFGVDLAGGVGNYLGGQLGAELARDIGVNPGLGSFVGGQLGLLAGDEVAGFVLGRSVTFASLVSEGSAAGSQIAGGVFDAAAQPGDVIVFDPYSAIGGFAGQELASLADPATTEDSALGGELGALVGGIIGQIAIPIPLVGAFIGAFVGELLGTVLGLWIGGPPPNPLALDEIQLTTNGTFGSIGELTKHLDVFPGIDRTGLMLGQQAASTINAVLAPIGGRVANLLTLPNLDFGVAGFLDDSRKTLAYNGGDTERFADPQLALMHGVLFALQTIQVEGGDVYLKRALFADLNGVNLDGLSDQQTTDLFQQVLSDQQLAQVYESYAQNPLLFDAGLAKAGDTSVHAGWVSIVARAQQLGLSNAVASDNYSQAADNAAFWASGQGTTAPSNGTGTITATGRAYVLDASGGVNHLVATSAIGDILNGGLEDDTLTATGLSNTLNAGTGNSTLTATGADNVLNAGSGTDILVASGTGNILYGSTGAVTMTVTGDSNGLLAGAGAAVLRATGNLNLLQGGSGTGTLQATGMQNALTAGSGDAQLTATGNQNVLTAGSGIDALTASGTENQFYGSTGIVSINTTGNNSAVQLNTGVATVHVQGDRNTVAGSSGAETVTITGSNNTIRAGAGALSAIVTGTGNTLTGSTSATDTVVLSGNGNRFVAGSGRDVISASGLDNVLVAGSGNETLTGSGSDIYLFSGADGTDTVNPGYGDTLRFGGIGGTSEASNVTTGDILFTASGSDLLVTVASTGEVITIRDDLTLLAPGTATSKLERIAFSNGTAIDLERGITFTWDGTAGGKTLTGSQYGANRFLAGAGDTLGGGTGVNAYLVGAASGAVTIWAGAQDTIQFGPDVDPTTVSVRADGADLVFSVAGTATTVRVVGALSLLAPGLEATALAHVAFLSNGTTWTGSQLLVHAGFAPDRGQGATSGNQGNGSSLFVGTAAATLVGDPGAANTYFFATGLGADTVDPGTHDTVEFAAGVSPTSIGFQAQGQDLVIQNYATGDTVRVAGNFSTSNGVVQSAVRQVLFAGGTSIDLTKPVPFTWDGTGGNQALYGSAFGTNLFFGGDGDTLVGAAGAPNTYVFGAFAGTETITPGANDLVEFDASVAPANIVMQAAGTTLVLKDKANGSSLNFLGAAGSAGGPIPLVGRVEFADGTVWDLRQQGLTFTWDGSAGTATITSSPYGSNTVIAGPGDTLVGSSSHSLYQIGYGVENLTILPGPSDTISFDRGVSSSNIEFQTQGSDLLILSSEDGHVIADIKGDLNETLTSGRNSAVGSLLFADGTSLSLSATLTYTWNDPAGGVTLTASRWGNNYFDLGPNDTADGRSSPYQDTYLYHLSDGDITILPGGNDVIKFTSEIAAADVSWAAMGNDLVVTLLPTGKKIIVVGDRLLTGEAVLRFTDGTTVVPNLSSSSGLGTLAAPAGPPPAALATWVGTATNTTLVGSNSTPNAFQLGAGGDSVSFGTGSQGGIVQNTVYFDKGDGAASVNTNSSPGVLYLGDDIAASDVIVQTDSIGRLVVSLRDDPADSITFNGDMHGLPGAGVSSDVTGIVLGDGPSIDLTSPSGPTSTWVGSPMALWLSGTGYGPNVFEIAPGSSSLLGPGNSLVYFGNGNGGGSNQNTVHFGRGSGNATVYTNGAPGVLYLGAGITASDVLVQVNISGWLTVALRDDPTDSITFGGALSGSAVTGVHSTISGIVLADGSSISLTSPLGPTSTWTAGTGTLASEYGPNVFELPQGGGDIGFGTGSQGGSNQNTVYFGRGDGTVHVYTQGSPGVLYLGSDIAASDVVLEVNYGGGLTVALRDDTADSISFYDDMQGSAATGLHSLVSSIVFGDGSTINLSAPSGPTSTWIGTTYEPDLTFWSSWSFTPLTFSLRDTCHGQALCR